MKRYFLLLLSVCFASIAALAETITYRIVEYNADAGDFVLAAHGMRPVGSYAMFENDFGATRGNRYNQIPRNKQATLWLEGWEGCVINSVTLAMCSNNSSGTAGLVVSTGEQELYSMRPAPFDDPEWLGHWLSKDLRTYVEITKEMANRVTIGGDGEVAITVNGGTPEGSVYLDAVTIDYTPSTAIGTESPLGWVFEKMEAKSTLADGDVIMLYRSGDAAGDIDGMEKSHYLDAVGLSSTTNVVEPFVEYFTLHRVDTHWTLTDQYGQMLAATGPQALTWVDASASSSNASAPMASASASSTSASAPMASASASSTSASAPISDASASSTNAVTTWDITLGYSGATIASTNTKYGTLRYNAPAESYPRFWNYTSTSLPLPYIYKRARQLQPVLCQSLELRASSTLSGTSDAFVNSPLNTDIAQQDTLLLTPVFYPANVTSHRLIWESTNPEVASVQSGVVFLHAPGSTTISASCRDWTPTEIGDGAMACIPPTAYADIIVTQSPDGILSAEVPAAATYYDTSGRRLPQLPMHGIYLNNGILRLHHHIK